MDYTIDKWLEVCSEMERLEIQFFGEFQCYPQDVSDDSIRTTRNKETKVNRWFLKFAELYSRSMRLTVAAGRKIEELNSHVVKGQEKVIGLQQEILKNKEELLKNKDAQLASFQTSVRDEVASVNTAVQSEIRKSWSKVAEQGSTKPISTAKLKEAVKSVIVEEDKSKSIMIFGKAEVENEDVGDTVANVLNDMNEKPRPIECLRVGKVTDTTGKPRPIKVKLSSSDAVANILRNAKLLKNSVDNKATFIGPDRSREERAAHRSLVEKMKVKIKEEPDYYHYIERGMIISVKRSTVARTNTPSTSRTDS